VTLIWSNTSAGPGFSMGASTIRIVWSAVTCRLGLSTLDGVSTSVTGCGEIVCFVPFNRDSGSVVGGGCVVGSTRDGAIISAQEGDLQTSELEPKEKR
jgi:hypothetical protein